MNRNLTYFNLNLTLLHPVKKDVVVEGQIFKRGNGYKPWLYKASLDACRFVKKPYNAIAIIVYKMFKQYSSFNHSCPYEVSEKYNLFSLQVYLTLCDFILWQGIVLVQKLSLRLDTLPHAIPTGDYLLQLDWIFSKKVQLITKAYFKFVEDL